jgi:hypothetical protein
LQPSASNDLEWLSERCQRRQAWCWSRAAADRLDDLGGQRDLADAGVTFRAGLKLVPNWLPACWRALGNGGTVDYLVDELNTAT